MVIFFSVFCGGLFRSCILANACSLSEGVNSTKYLRKYSSCSSNDLNILIDRSMNSVLKISMLFNPVTNVVSYRDGRGTGCKQFSNAHFI